MSDFSQKHRGYDQNRDAPFDMKVETITEGMIPYFVNILPYENAHTIVKFDTVNGFIH